MGYTIGILMLLAHVSAYKEYLIDIGINFSVTYVLKRLLRSFDDGSKTKSDLVGLGGYALTSKSFFVYLKAIQDTGCATEGIGNSDGLFQQLIKGIKGENIKDQIQMFINNDDVKKSIGGSVIDNFIKH